MCSFFRTQFNGGLPLVLLLALASFLFPLQPAQAAITYVASASNPTDNNSLGTSPVSVIPPASMQAGDLVILVANVRESGKTLAISSTGGQTWTAQATNATTTTQKIFWARFNGTWSTNPSVAYSGAGTESATTLVMHVFRPSLSTNYWVLDVAQVDGSFSAPASPYDVAIPGITTNTAGALVFATWASTDNNAWTLQTAGWANAGLAQYRNQNGNDSSQSAAYRVMATAGASGNVTNRQTNNGPDAGNRSILAFKEISVTTLASGADPAATTIAPGAAVADVNLFTLQTNMGTEAVTAVTVNLSTNSGVGRLAITDNAGTELGFTTTPVAGNNTISVSGMSATTTLATFKVRVTPLSHAAMPVPPGASYAITVPVTAWAGPNQHVGSDTNVNALTIDNASPASVTSVSGSASTLRNTVNWTTSAATDFANTSGSVIYRWAAASAGTQVPAEGSTPALGSTNGTATVACLVSSAALTPLTRVDGSGGSADCTTTALVAGQAYTYKVFQKDSSGNFDAGVTIGTFTPTGNVSASVSTVAANPTSVAADNYNFSTITVTLKDSAGTPVPGKSVTLAAGSGSSIITTVNGISDAAGVATFTVKNGTVEGPITYTATDATDAIVITQTAQVTFTTPSLCFTDDFNRASLLSTSNWTRTRGAGTTYDADIVNNRLRLTDAVGNRATAVHLNRIFPGGVNKIVAEFDYFAYNGNGADGVVMALSDASIAPVAGAFGGSLGYAQKSNPGSDCTVVGGCPGFAGGWIGVGLDEFGNYSNPTEGRVGGPGLRPDNVVIRGSGSGQSGYNYHTGVSAPGLDNAASTSPAPGHRYRVTVDHSDGVHAWVMVDRDTTGTGNSYVNLIPSYDAQAIATQAAVPASWYFSFTGTTGASYNIHEIDNFQVCTAQPIVAPVLDHLRIIHDGSALTCRAEDITLKACANPTCSALYPGSVTVDLSTISGAIWSVDPVTFSGGQVEVSLTKSTAGTVTLGGNVTSPSSLVGICYNGAASGDCSLTYSSSSCSFDAVEPGQGPGTPIFTKLAGVPFTVDVLALTAGVINPTYNRTITVDLVDDAGVADGVCSTTSLASPTGSTAWNNGRRTYTFNYPNAARDVRVRVDRLGTQSCSSDDFAIRPVSFNVTSPNASNAGSSGAPAVKTGAAFGLDAASASGYTGTALLNPYRIEAHAGAAQTGTLAGTFSAASSASGWISKGTAFTYSEVGNFRFAPWGVYDDGSFADVDRGKATPECFIDNKIGTAADPADPNVKDGNGMYGCYFGGTDADGDTEVSPYFGRFIPDHFDTVVSGGMPCPLGLTCPATGFVYSGQPFPGNVYAKNASGATTLNYSGAYARAIALSAVDAVGGSAIGAGIGGIPAANSSIAAAAFAAGVATQSVIFQFASTPTNPTNMFVRAVESGGDGVTSLRASGSVEGGFRVVSGRARIGSRHGSELLNLPINVTVQYWNGTEYVTSRTDSATQFTAPGDLTFDNYQKNLTSVSVVGAPVTVTFSSGACNAINGCFTLAAPGAGHNGSVNITLDSPAYLPSNTARATFGVYQNANEFIYMRENY